MTPRLTLDCKQTPGDHLMFIFPNHKGENSYITVYDDPVGATVELDDAQLHQLADFIKEHVPVPPPFERGDFVHYKLANGGTGNGLFIGVDEDGSWLKVRAVSGTLLSLPPQDVRPVKDES